jgi:hypothetical protein
MTRSKLTSAALFFGIMGTMLFLPPLVLLFNVRARFLGVPAEVIYLFAVWLVLVAGTAWFSSRMPHEGDEKSEDAG